MSKFKYEVSLPDGSVYLTTTLREAQELERRHGKYGLVENSSAPMSRKERMKPALNDGYKHPPQAWVREVLQNSFDNDATNVILEFGENDALAIDNGTGMSRDTLLNKFLVPGMSEKKSGAVGGFGEAKKLLTFPWDYFAMVTLAKGGKLQVVLGVGGSWDYWEDGQCYDVEYNDADEPKWTEITPTSPNPKYLPYSEISSIIARVKKQKVGTALYIRGTETLHAYLASIESDKVLGGNKGLPSPADATSYVVMCELPGKTIDIQGVPFRPNVKIPKDAKKFPASQTYSGLEVYFVPPSADSCAEGNMVVRAKSRRGTQVMWTEPSPAPGTVFVEITGDTKRILNNTRDSFDFWANEWWNKFKTKFAKDVGSMFLDMSMDEEFIGSVGAESAASLRQESRQARDTAWDARWKFEQENPTTPSQQKRAAEEVVKEIEQAARQKPSREKKIEEQTAPIEVTKDIVADASSEGAAAIEGAVGLALWRPPFRIMNNFTNWQPSDEYLPDTMGEYQIRLLRAWTEALRRVLALIGHFDHQYGVGFVFTSEVLALTTPSKKLPGVQSYLINPYVSKNELRDEKLFIPPRRVTLTPTEPTSIPIDVTDEQHLSIVVSRAVHEIVHGVYGVTGHDEMFSSVMTTLVAQIGDQYSKIIKAAKAGAKAPVPKLAKKKGASRPAVREGRKTPERVQRALGGVDPRLPPVGSVLQRDQGGDTLTAVVLPEGKILSIVKDNNSFRVVSKVYPSLSKAVASFLGQNTYNGYRYFDLLDGYRNSKYLFSWNTIKQHQLAELQEDLASGRFKMHSIMSDYIDYQ